MNNVKAVRLPAVDGALPAETTPGTFQFTAVDFTPTDDPRQAMGDYEGPAGKGAARIVYACPRTGEACGGLVIGHKAHPDSSPSWSWNGDLDAPTLRPDITCMRCNFHGRLKAGEFVNAGDATLPPVDGSHAPDTIEPAAAEVGG